MSTPTDARPISRDELLRKAVITTVTELQRRATGAHHNTGAHHDTGVTARLARLRRAVTVEPGSEPLVWADTLGALPEELVPTGRWADDTPTHYERAAHEAITLYALHQQSKSTAAHVPGISLGAAARRLAKATGRDDAIRTRFQAVATAGTASGVSHHLRALITLLRAEDIPLDYGRLAVDLRHLHGGAGDRVRLRWGRDFHRAATDEPDTPTDRTQAETDNTRNKENA